MKSFQEFKINDSNLDNQQNQVNDRKKEFEYIKQMKLQFEILKTQNETHRSQSFAFNKEGTVLFVACKNVIIVYYNGKSNKKLVKLTNHKNDIFCLYFMRQSNSLVSGSADNSIIIWKFHKNSFCSPNYLNDHKGSIYCVLTNKREDLLISGSGDKTIKFWEKIENYWISKQTIEIRNKVLAISLNEQENKLIVCGLLSAIKVIEIQNDNTWKIVQVIIVIQWGCRLSFTYGNQFIFQPETHDFVELYDFDEKQKQYKKLKEIKVGSCEKGQWLFPCKFLRQLDVLTVKQGEALNIFRTNVQGNYQIIQTIQFYSRYVFGTMSDDGQLLVTWDKEYQKIQIIKLHLQ